MNMHNNHNHRDHVSSHKRLFTAIILNAIITISEYIGGLASGSLALVSDAGHNLSDVLSLMLGYAGERISEKSPTSAFTFGLKRFEVLISMVNSVSLLVIGVYILYESVMRFLHPSPIDLGIMVPVAFIGLAGNVFSMLLLMSKRGSSLNMKASFLHLLYDTVSSLAVIAAAAVIYVFGIEWIDIAISVLIVIMIFASSIGILREALRIFLQGTPSSIDTDDVYRSLLAVQGIGGIHGLHIWSISSNEVFLSAHICLNDESVSINTDGVLRSINDMLGEKYGIHHTTLQIERSQICSLEGGECCR